jgi:hypothetical protein
LVPGTVSKLQTIKRFVLTKTVSLAKVLTVDSGERATQS